MKKTVITTATALLVASSTLLPNGVAGGDKPPAFLSLAGEEYEQQVKDLDAMKRLVKEQQRQRQIEQAKKERDEKEKAEAKRQLTLASRSGENVQQWQPYVATFYTLAEGSGTGRTATGTIPTAGRTLAVDPRVIPLGSTVEVMYPDGSVEQRIAEDTGGAIKGNILDVYVVTVEEALRRGRQKVQLRVIHTP